MTQRVFPVPVALTMLKRQAPKWGRPTLGGFVMLLCFLALLALFPFWVPVVLAAWTAVIARPLHKVLSKRIHRRRGAAALVTVLLVVAFLTPVLVTGLSLASAGVELGQRLLESKSAPEALRALAVHGDGTDVDFKNLNLDQLIDFGRRHGSGAMAMAKTLFGAATVAVLAVVVFVSAFYTFLLDGPRIHEWLLVHSPLDRGKFHRFSSVFEEVGRGLLVGVGLTAVLQGAVATIGYVACGVPQPLVLGLATMFASLIPSVGSGLVWLPVSAGLFMSGRHGAAAAMLGIGCVVALVDNVVRPLLAQYGHLRMHGLLLFMAMLGGMAVFGASGLLLGPLVVRFAIEGLSMLRESEPQSFPAG
jgi:predicted PurR-regulated permease PerM